MRRGRGRGGRRPPPAAAKLPEPIVFKRGEYLFNRRFFETKFAGFFRVVPSEAEKDLVLLITAARGQFAGRRISRITPNELYLQVVTNNASADEMIPWGNHRGANPAQGQLPTSFLMPLRVVFMGTARWACASLKALLDSGQWAVAAVVTQPDRPVGRELKARPSPVKIMAMEAGLRVLQPERVGDAAFAGELGALRPEVIVVAAYGQILPRAALELPRLGCVNVHASRCPSIGARRRSSGRFSTTSRKRASPSCGWLADLDTGDVLSQRATVIDPDETAAMLHDRLAVMGGSCWRPRFRNTRRGHHAAAAGQRGGDLREKNQQVGRAAGLVAIRVGVAEPGARVYPVARHFCALA